MPSWLARAIELRSRLAARLDDSTAHFRAAARRFTRLLKRASEDEPEATKLAFRLEVVGQAVE